MKILIIQNKYMGDVLMASTIANNLKKNDPSCQIHFLCYPNNAQIISTNPNIDKIITVEEKKTKKIIGLFKIIQQIRGEKFDVLIDSYEKTFSKLISKFSGILTRISYPEKDFFKVYTHHIKLDLLKEEPYGFAITNRLALINPIVSPGFKKEYEHPLFLSINEIERGKAMLKENNISFNKPLLMLGVLGSKEEKTYPLPYMGELINKILDNHNLDILFNYIPNQAKQIKELMSFVHSHHQKNIHLNIIGKNIREFASIMYHCDMHISNEGGGCHISKALNKPTFTIFSPYIKVTDWNTFANNTLFEYSDLKELKPELFRYKTQKEWRKNSLNLYKNYEPDLIFLKINNFIKKSLQF